MVGTPVRTNSSESTGTSLQAKNNSKNTTEPTTTTTTEHSEDNTISSQPVSSGNNNNDTCTATAEQSSRKRPREAITSAADTEQSASSESPKPSSVRTPTRNPPRPTIRNPYSQSNSKPKSKSKSPARTPSSIRCALSSNSTDDDCLVISPPRRAPLLLESKTMEQQSAQKNNNNGDDNEDDEDVMVLGTNLVNPNIDMPHARPYCGVYSFAKDKLQFCDKCYCIKCDKPAKECDQWTQHCHEVYKKPEKKIAPSEGLQDVIDVEDTPPADSTTVTSSLLNGIDPAVQSYYASNAASLRTLAEEGLELEQAAPYHTSQHDNAYSGNFNRNQTSQHDNEYSGNLNRNYNDGFGHHGGRSHKDMRILEVFAQKLAGAVVQSEITPSSSPSRGVDNDDTGDDSWIAMMIEMYRNQRFDQSPMEGDIPQLKLHKSFFVEGVRIGWPFPAILPPQRQMAIHLIKALKNKRHVVLESPTGTGKSATLLCTVLAWQRWHGKITWGKPAAENRADTDNSQNMDVKDAPSNDTFPKIIYCSRTHSQVEQMVASLKKTPYRPRMTVLGSRERLCIHRNIIDRDPSNGNKTNKKRSLTNVSTECQMRRRNTERIRKDLWKCLDFLYDDNNPPDLPGDRQNGSVKEGDPLEEGDNAPEEEVEDDNSNGDDEDSPDRIMNKSKKKRTCPHFRELTTERTAEMVRSRFIPSQKEVQCCSSGSEKTSLGVHDIEDLVASGVNPYKIKVALYRGSGEGPFGFELDDNCRIKNIDSVGAAKSASLLRRGDKIIAVNGKKLQTLSDICKEVENSKDPLELTVRRPSWSRDYIRRTSERPHVLSDNSASEVLADSIVRGVDLEGGEMEDLIEVGESDTIYSPHAACPYYLSRGLARYADLIFAPYNYVLDPDIRAALGINLDGAVVVLDEAHNVEGTLTESGSGKFGEIELTSLVSMLLIHSTASKSDKNKVEFREGGEEMDLSVVAHELLCFIEKISVHLYELRKKFESGKGKNSAAGAIEEYLQFKTSDDQEFEVAYVGPSGHGVHREAVGCKPFFEKLNITNSEIETLCSYAEAMERHLIGDSGPKSSKKFGEQGGNSAFDFLNEILSKFRTAIKTPQHFYISCVIQVNGNFDYAAGIVDDDDGDNSRKRLRKKPKDLPYIYPRSEEHPKAGLPACRHEACKPQGVIMPGYNKSFRRHGDWFKDEVTPRWEAHLVLKLLFPGLLMKDLANQCRTMILASGSLSPIPSLCAELDLHDEKAKDGRLQTKPKPLEANHVVKLSKQLLAVSVGHFPDGTPLTVSYTNYQNHNFFPRLGHALATICESIPRGGVLIFLPSYSFLNRCIKCWDPTYAGENACPEIWERFICSKSKVIVEPVGSQEKFEAARDDYRETIKRTSACLLLAVFRGKMSEGISFNDDNARGVICVGIPFPGARDRGILAKKAYNEEQRKLENRKNLLPGNDWYSQQAYQAISQALGRCIRHAADYGTIILLDSRHCDDGSPGFTHSKLPQWMRNHVRNLSMPGRTRSGSNPILGGYKGLAQEMESFFQQAPAHVQTVTEQMQLDFEKGREREKRSAGHQFNRDTGSWTQNTGAD